MQKVLLLTSLTALLTAGAQHLQAASAPAPVAIIDIHMHAMAMMRPRRARTSIMLFMTLS